MERQCELARPPLGGWDGLSIIPQLRIVNLKISNCELFVRLHNLHIV